jgi:hypothetical protein
MTSFDSIYYPGVIDYLKKGKQDGYTVWTSYMSYLPVEGEHPYYDNEGFYSLVKSDYLFLVQSKPKNNSETYSHTAPLDLGDVSVFSLQDGHYLVEKDRYEVGYFSSYKTATIEITRSAQETHPLFMYEVLTTNLSLYYDEQSRKYFQVPNYIRNELERFRKVTKNTDSLLSNLDSRTEAYWDYKDFKSTIFRLNAKAVHSTYQPNSDNYYRDMNQNLKTMARKMIYRPLRLETEFLVLSLTPSFYDEFNEDEMNLNVILKNFSVALTPFTFDYHNVNSSNIMQIAKGNMLTLGRESLRKFDYVKIILKAAKFLPYVATISLLTYNFGIDNLAKTILKVLPKLPYGNTLMRLNGKFCFRLLCGAIPLIASYGLNKMVDKLPPSTKTLIQRKIYYSFVLKIPNYGGIEEKDIQCREGNSILKTLLKLPYEQKLFNGVGGKIIETELIQRPAITNRNVQILLKKMSKAYIPHKLTRNLISKKNKKYNYTYFSKGVPNAIAVLRRQGSAILKPSRIFISAFDRTSDSFLDSFLESFKIKAEEYSGNCLKFYLDNLVSTKQKNLYKQEYLNRGAWVRNNRPYELLIKRNELILEEKGKEKWRPRCIFNPPIGVKPMLGSINKILIETLKIVYPGFICGYSDQQLSEKFSREIFSLEDPVAICLDGSSHDAYQHADYIQKADIKLARAIAPYLTKLGFDDQEAKFIRHHLELEKIKYVFKENKETPIRGTISGTTFSGHPTRTTFGNSVRVLLYILTALNESLSSLNSRKDLYLYISGDDIALVCERKSSIEIKFKLVNSYGEDNLAGILANPLKIVEIEELDFLSRRFMISRADKNVHITRAFSKMLFGTIAQNSLQQNLTEGEIQYLYKLGLETSGAIPLKGLVREWFDSLPNGKQVSKKKLEDYKIFDRWEFKACNPPPHLDHFLTQKECEDLQTSKKLRDIEFISIDNKSCVGRVGGKGLNFNKSMNVKKPFKKRNKKKFKKVNDGNNQNVRNLVANLTRKVNSLTFNNNSKKVGQVVREETKEERLSRAYLDKIITPRFPFSHLYPAGMSSARMIWTAELDITPTGTDVIVMIDPYEANNQYVIRYSNTPTTDCTNGTTGTWSYFGAYPVTNSRPFRPVATIATVIPTGSITSLTGSAVLGLYSASDAICPPLNTLQGQSKWKMIPFVRENLYKLVWIPLTGGEGLTFETSQSALSATRKMYMMFEGLNSVSTFKVCIRMVLEWIPNTSSWLYDMRDWGGDIGAYNKVIQRISSPNFPVVYPAGFEELQSYQATSAQQNSNSLTFAAMIKGEIKKDKTMESDLTIVDDDLRKKLDKSPDLSDYKNNMKALIKEKLKDLALKTRDKILESKDPTSLPQEQANDLIHDMNESGPEAREVFRAMLGKLNERKQERYLDNMNSYLANFNSETSARLRSAAAMFLGILFQKYRGKPS